MRKIYNQIYYRCYDFITINGKYDLAWGGIHFLSLFSAFLFIEIISSLIKVTSIEYFIYPSIYFGLLITNYIIFLRKDSYKLILEQFKNESLRKRRFGRFCVLFVMIGLIIIAFI